MPEPIRPDYTTAFKNFAAVSIRDIRSNLSLTKTNASGKLSRSLREETKPEKLRIYALDYMSFAEEGRGPTKRNGPGELRKAIRKWIDDKGIKLAISSKASKRTINKAKDSLAYIITRRIHFEGTLLHKLRERREIFDKVFSTEKIRTLLGEMQEKNVNVLSDIIRRRLK